MFIASDSELAMQNRLLNRSLRDVTGKHPQLGTHSLIGQAGHTFTTRRVKKTVHPSDHDRGSELRNAQRADLQESLSLM